MEQIKLLCPYCNAEYDMEMKNDFEDTGSGCNSCGYDEFTGSISIYCKNCKKLVYKKEGVIIP